MTAQPRGAGPQAPAMEQLAGSLRATLGRARLSRDPRFDGRFHAWRPWRAYAAIHLWRVAQSQPA